MIKPLDQGYRLQFYKDTSWGVWVTIGEYQTKAQVEEARRNWVGKNPIRCTTAVGRF